MAKPPKPLGLDHMVVPLDYKILACLEPEGKVMDDVPIGTTVKSMKSVFPSLNADQLSTRLRMLNAMGLTKQVRGIGTGGTMLWQVTTQGQEVLKEWRQ